MYACYSIKSKEINVSLCVNRNVSLLHTCTQILHLLEYFHSYFARFRVIVGRNLFQKLANAECPSAISSYYLCYIHLCISMHIAPLPLPSTKFPTLNMPIAHTRESVTISMQLASRKRHSKRAS